MKGGQGLESHLDRNKGSCGNLGASLHGVPQLTLDMGGILIRQAQRLLLSGEKRRSQLGLPKPPRPHLRESKFLGRLIRSLGPWRRKHLSYILKDEQEFSR